MEPHRERLPFLARGAAVVEFAIVLTLMLLITAGIFEFGRAFEYYDALAKATRDGAVPVDRAQGNYKQRRRHQG